MVAEQWNSSEQVARLVRQSLEEGATVEIDGLGSFRPSPDGQFEFVPQTRPQVFLAYVEEDYAIVHRLYSQLRAHGCEPWLDKKKLLAGQNWPLPERHRDFGSLCRVSRSGRVASADTSRGVALGDDLRITTAAGRCLHHPRGLGVHRATGIGANCNT
jgi:hypothetical protein